MENEREILEKVTIRLRRALENGTGTSFDPDEVQFVGQLLHAFASAIANAGGGGREACVVCGSAEHPEQAVGPYPKHDYEPGILVPKVTSGQ